MKNPALPRCKNTRYGHGCHPHYAEKYNGYCLECANAGIDEADAKIDELEKKLVAAQAALKISLSFAETVADEICGPSMTQAKQIEWANELMQSIAAVLREQGVET